VRLFFRNDPARQVAAREKILGRPYFYCPPFTAPPESGPQKHMMAAIASRPIGDQALF
jgi:hypothetical protein